MAAPAARLRQVTWQRLFWCLGLWALLGTAGSAVAGNPVAGNPVAGNPVAGNPVTEEGQHSYHEFPVPIGSRDAPAPELALLVTLPCPDCQQLLDVLGGVAASKLRVMPAVFDAPSMTLARAYYVAEHCGIGTEGQRLLGQQRSAEVSVKALATRLAAIAEPVDGSRCQTVESFMAAFEAPAVLQKVQQAAAWGHIVRPQQLPALVIAGRWRIQGLTASQADAVKVEVNRLLRRARAQKEHHGLYGNG